MCGGCGYIPCFYELDKDLDKGLKILNELIEISEAQKTYQDAMQIVEDINHSLLELLFQEEDFERLMNTPSK